DIVRLQPGQQVLVSLDAYSNESTVFEAHITRIFPQKDARTRTFTVHADFKELPERLYAGLAGEANIIINVADQALTIPRGYLISDNQVNTDNGLITIEVGRRNMELVEVLSGLDTTTNLLPPQ
ncbi:MAG: efflux transporter periplasmic adaptor subunit, partial [Ekhidna sp.]|nr:efflux transporter periplasmic adaptor subunit [Ekhidna sp.]